MAPQEKREVCRRLTLFAPGSGRTSDDGAPGRGSGMKLRLRLIRLGRSAVNFLGMLFYAISAVLIALAAWAAWINVSRSGWNADAAGWVQAAGSVAAIAGAAWLSQGETRRARRARREEGEELAWYVRFAIKQAQYETHIVAFELVHREGPISRSDVREWLQRVDTCAVSLGFLAGRTDYIHPAVSHAIANAKVLVDYLIEDLRELQKSVELEQPIDDKLKDRIVGPHISLTELVQVFDSRMAGVLEALDRGGDALPRDGWAIWRETTRQP